MKLLTLALPVAFTPVALGAPVRRGGTGGLLNSTSCYSHPNSKDGRAPGTGNLKSGDVVNVSCYATGERVGGDLPYRWYFTEYGCWVPSSVFYGNLISGLDPC